MIPPNYNLKVYQGDAFGDELLITLPDLTPLGGPANLSTATLAGEIREKKDSTSPIMAVFTMQIVDPTLRQIRPRLTPTESAKLTKGGFYDIQVVQGTWIGTVLEGQVDVVLQVTV